MNCPLFYLKIDSFGHVYECTNLDLHKYSPGKPCVYAHAAM